MTYKYTKRTDMQYRAETNWSKKAFQRYIDEHTFIGDNEYCPHCGTSRQYLYDLFYDVSTNAMPYCRDREDFDKLMEEHRRVADMY